LYLEWSKNFECALISNIGQIACSSHQQHRPAAVAGTGSVHIQVVPYGKMEAIARSEYGDPMVDMGLHYLEDSVAAEEMMETLRYAFYWKFKEKECNYSAVEGQSSYWLGWPCCMTFASHKSIGSNHSGIRARPNTALEPRDVDKTDGQVPSIVMVAGRHDAQPTTSVLEYPTMIRL
jgi:hypothetical protein